MRPLAISVCCLLLLPLGCNAADKDPDAAAKAARSAAGALVKKQSALPDDEPGRIIDHEGKLPSGPGRPGDFKPPPAVGTATCITDDGDDASDHPDGGDDQKGPGGVIKGPGIKPLDPKVPTTETAVPNAAASGAKSKSKSKGKGTGKGTGKTAVAPQKHPKTTKGVARSATGSGPEPMTTDKVANRVNWDSLCESRMDDGSCQSLCEAHEMTWDSNAGNNGTCHEKDLAAPSVGGTASSVECGCMCRPG